MATQQGTSALRAKLEQAEGKLTDAKRSRSASQASSHRSSDSLSGAKPVNAPIPEESEARTDNGAGSGTLGPARARGGSGSGEPSQVAANPGTTGNASKGKDVEDESSDSEEEEPETVEGTTRQTSNPAPTGTGVSAPSARPTRPPAPAQTGNGRVPVVPTGPGPRAPEAYPGLTAAQIVLVEELAEINGQDSYDALAASVGKLKSDEYLRIPEAYPFRPVRPEAVGTPQAHNGSTYRDWAQVYAANKNAAPVGTDAMMFALIRMEAVKAGWVDGQREVTIVARDPAAVQTLLTDLPTIKDRVEIAKTAAFIVPLVAEHVFRTMGHHFLSTDAANYTARYADTFRACLTPDIANLLPPASLYHAVLHWVSPARAREVLVAQVNGSHIPDALKIRANAAPAGTAIVTTTAAIITSMSQSNLADGFARAGRFDLDMIRRVSDLVKENPCKYHKTYFAYGVAPPSAAESAELDAAKQEAERFAPYAQAFVNAFLQNAAMGRAKALQKHADANPVQLRRATTFFRAVAKMSVLSVDALFASSLTKLDEED